MEPPRPTACCGWRPAASRAASAATTASAGWTRAQFALVLPGMTAESAAALVGRLAGGFGWSLDGDPITVSGGVAAFPEHAATNDELVRLASAALESRRRRPA